MEVEAPSGGNERLNKLVAVTVVAISVFMALCSVKSGNIGQNMALAKADAVDTWSEYQATRLKLHMAENSLSALALSSAEAGANATLVAAEKKRLEKAKSRTLMAQARGHEEDYATLNVHDDQFDMSDAFMSIALALAAVTVFVNLEWLLFVSWGFAAVGFIMGGAGFLGLNLHSDFIANLLG
jgi:divalent metal cation (Fe/Co/Zn/Cd) transporter